MSILVRTTNCHPDFWPFVQWLWSLQERKMNRTLLVTLGRMSRIWECCVFSCMCFFCYPSAAADLNPHEKGEKNSERRKENEKCENEKSGWESHKISIFDKIIFYIHVSRKSGYFVIYFKTNRRKSVKSVSLSEWVSSLLSLFPGWSFSLRHKNASFDGGGGVGVGTGQARLARMTGVFCGSLPAFFCFLMHDQFFPHVLRIYANSEITKSELNSFQGLF